MSRRAANHRRHLPRMGTAARLLAAVAVAIVGYAQFATSWHETTVQHVVCAEHGELTHVGPIPTSAPTRAPEQAGIQPAKPETVEAHEHCGFVFAPESSTPSPVIRVAVQSEPPPAVPRQPADPAPRPGRAFVLASAPKTSPPVA